MTVMRKVSDLKRGDTIYPCYHVSGTVVVTYRARVAMDWARTRVHFHSEPSKEIGMRVIWKSRDVVPTKRRERE